MLLQTDRAFRFAPANSYYVHKRAHVHRPRHDLSQRYSAMSPTPRLLRALAPIKLSTNHRVELRLARLAQLHDATDLVPDELRANFAVALVQLRSAIDSLIDSIALSVAVRPTVMDSAAR